MNTKIVMISGGFDPLHCGHLELIDEARNLAYMMGGEVLAVVDSDEYVSSKHKLMMPQNERASIVESIRGVSSVWHSKTSDGNCQEALELFEPSIYLVGPDHADHTKLPEFHYCDLNHIKILTARHHRAKEWHSRDYAQPKWVNPIVTVSALIKFPGEKLLIAKRGQEDGKGKYELPGGFLECGENLKAGLHREVFEETQLSLSQLEHFNSFPGKYSDGRDIISIYFTAVSGGTPKVSDECLGYEYWDCVKSDQFFNECDYKAVHQYFEE